MSKSYIFGGVFRGGRFVPDDVPAFAVRASKLEGVRVRATFVKPGTKATTSQHGYYRTAVLPTITEWCGYDLRDKGDLQAVHEGLKRKVFGAEIKNGLEIVESHADYDVEKFRTFLDLVLRWCAEGGLYVPSPEEWTG